MTRQNFDEELDSLNHDLIRMGGAVEKQIDNCITALAKQDDKLALQILDNDDVIDRMETDIEAKCVKIIARQQPLAMDLRKVFTTIKLVTDLERIADYAVDIAKITIRLKNEEYIKPLIDIPKMADIVQKMIKDSLDAYVRLDVDAAQSAGRMDDDVDDIYRDVFQELLGIMAEDPSTVVQGTQFLFVCKFLERIGDHVTNICEWIIYLVTGEHRNLNN